MSDENSIVLKAVDRAGAPVRDAMVAVEASTVPFPEIALVTNDEGVVKLTLPRGRFRVGVYASGDRRGVTEIDLETGDQQVSEICVVVKLVDPT